VSLSRRKAGEVRFLINSSDAKRPTALDGWQAEKTVAGNRSREKTGSDKWRKMKAMRNSHVTKPTSLTAGQRHQGSCPTWTGEWRHVNVEKEPPSRTRKYGVARFRNVSAGGGERKTTRDVNRKFLEPDGTPRWVCKGSPVRAQNKTKHHFRPMAVVG